MFSEKSLMALVMAEEPGCTVDAYVYYEGRYIVRIQHESPDEAHYDPFYAVDAATGKVSEFSVTTDPDISPISALFEAADNTG